VRGDSVVADPPVSGHSSLRIAAWSGRQYDRKASTHVAVHHEASVSAGRYNKCLLPKVLNPIRYPISESRQFHQRQEVFQQPARGHQHGTAPALRGLHARSRSFPGDWHQARVRVPRRLEARCVKFSLDLVLPERRWACHAPHRLRLQARRSIVAVVKLADWKPIGVVKR